MLGRMADLNAVLGQFNELMLDLRSAEDDTTAEGSNVFRFSAAAAPFEDSGGEDVTEVAILRRNNLSLIEALGEERNLRSKAERVLSMAKDEMQLLRLEGEAEVEGYRLASCRLQNQVRCLCEESGLEEVYRLFEAELKRQSKEIHALRVRNVQLETSDLEHFGIEAANNSTESVSPAHSSSPINAPPFAGYSNKESKRLLFRYRQKAIEADNLWKECEKLRAMERSHAFSLRQSRDFTRRLNLATQMTQRHKALNEQEQVDHAKTRGLLAVVQHEANALEEECRNQRKEIEALKGEQVLLRTRLTDAQLKARQTAKVAKHKGGGFR